MDYVKLGVSPVSEKKPSGTDVRYEPIFDELQAELDKLGSVTAREQFDWNNVRQPAAIILKSHSKDLLVAAYLGASLMHTGGAEGLRDSVALMEGLVKTHWDTLYPPKKRMRGRVSALKWWLDQTSGLLDDNAFPSLEPAVVGQMETLLTDLGEFLRSREKELKVENVGSAFPIDSVKGKIKGLTAKAPSGGAEESSGGAGASSGTAEGSPAGDDASGTGTSGGKASGDGASGGGGGAGGTSGTATKGKASTAAQGPPPEIPDIPEEAGTPSEARKNLEKLFQGIRQQVRYLRQDKPEDPRPYVWARLALWDTVDQLPPAAEGRTRIPPPPEHAMNALKNFKASGEWRDLLENAEAKLTNPQYLFCLDISRYAAEALGNMGESYEAAHGAVCRETLNFVERFPSLQGFSYADGRPFADEETVQWLNELRQSGAGGPSGGPAASGAPAEGEIGEELAAARELSKGKKGLSEAVGGLQRSIGLSASGRAAFMRRLGLVRILMEKRKPESAEPHLELLLREIDTHGLERWEPGLAMEAFRMAVNLFGTAKDEGKKSRVPALKDRITLIDTVEAMALP